MPQNLPTVPIAFPPCAIRHRSPGLVHLRLAPADELGNNAGTVDPNAIPRFNGEVSNAISASLQAYLPDSWVNKRGPPSPTPPPIGHLNNVDLSSVTFTTPASLGTATAPLYDLAGRPDRRDGQNQPDADHHGHRLTHCHMVVE